jgi:hypothetical protein
LAAAVLAGVLKEQVLLNLVAAQALPAAVVAAVLAQLQPTALLAVLAA